MNMRVPLRARTAGLPVDGGAFTRVQVQASGGPATEQIEDHVILGDSIYFIANNRSGEFRGLLRAPLSELEAGGPITPEAVADRRRDEWNHGRRLR